MDLDIIAKATQDIVGQAQRLPQVYYKKADGTFEPFAAPVYYISEHYPRFVFERLRSALLSTVEEIRSSFSKSYNDTQTNKETNQ